MADIIQLTDRVAEITQSSIARTLSIGNDWTRLRIAMRWSMQSGSNKSPGVEIVNYPRMAFGLCSGTGSSFMLSGSNTVSCKHFLGFVNAESTSSTANPSSISNNLGNFLPGYTNPLTRGEHQPFTIWHVQSDTSSFVSATYDPGTNHGGAEIGWNLSTPFTDSFSTTYGPNPNRTLFLLEYTKHNYGWTMQCGYKFNFSNIDSTVAQLEQWCTQVSPIFNPSQYEMTGQDPSGAPPLTNSDTGLPPTFSINEGTYGPLDTVTFYWNKPFPAVYISDILAAKLA
jgi:hypothetical protein